MRYEIVGPEGSKPKIAYLCPVINLKEITKHYTDTLLNKSIISVMICDLYLDPNKKKTSNSLIKEYLNDLVPHLIDAGIELLVVTQPDYFKVLTKQTKTDATIGDVLPTVIDGVLATYCPNYSRVFYDPDKIKARITQTNEAIHRWAGGDTSATGEGIIKYAHYPKTTEDILAALDRLLKMGVPLTVDIEGFDLKHYSAGIGTITFCWNQHEGIAFAVDYVTDNSQPGLQGVQIKNPIIRQALREFFEKSNETMIYHNVCYDVYVLIYQLFMNHILDQEGLLYGLEVMLKNWECTQIISYLATNSCAGNELGLKAQAQEYAGNYAVEDIHDITKIPLDELLKYNLIDGLSTWYVYTKNMPIAISDDQMTPYREIFRPAVVDIIQMQLTGMPINMEKVKALDSLLNQESDDLVQKMINLPLIKNYIYYLGDEAISKKNEKLKTKQVSREDLGTTKDLTVEFNPQSPKQLQELLYSDNFLGLPVLDYTDTKLPSTGADTLEKLKNHTKGDEQINLFLDTLIEYKASAIIISTFLPAFLQAAEGNDGWHYLFGNFRIGGTASGRLSSNKPNLQNIPSSGASKYKQRLAKLIKECFEAPPGWLFVGLDFDSLEDKISAVTTKDPEKIKVYSDGYDGHCLRAAAYFADKMPDIEIAPEGSQTYKASIGDNEVYFHSDEKVTYLGQEMTGRDLFERLSND